MKVDGNQRRAALDAAYAAEVSKIFSVLCEAFDTVGAVERFRTGMNLIESSYETATKLAAAIEGQEERKGMK